MQVCEGSYVEYRQQIQNACTIYNTMTEKRRGTHTGSAVVGCSTQLKSTPLCAHNPLKERHAILQSRSKDSPGLCFQFFSRCYIVVPYNLNRNIL